MKRIVGAVAAAMMAGALLTGCGGDDKSASPNESTDTSTTTSGDTTTPPTTTTTTDDGGDDNGATGEYCDDLKTAKVTVEALGGSTMTQESFDKMADVLHSIADEAPADVADDWNKLSDAIDAIEAALQSAGITFDDLAKLGQPGGPTVDPATVRALSTALKGLDEQGLSASSSAINAEVLKDCDFALGVGG